jgi:hypothetical protein
MARYSSVDPRCRDPPRVIRDAVGELRKFMNSLPCFRATLASLGQRYEQLTKDKKRKKELSIEGMPFDQN